VLAQIKATCHLVHVLLHSEPNRGLACEGTSYHTFVFKWHLLHGHLDAHGLLELHLLQELKLGLVCGCGRCRAGNVSLRGHIVIVVVVAELTILTVAHHHQVALEFLLLRRVELAVLIIAVVFFFLSVLVIFVICLAKTRFILPVLPMLLSITVVLLRGELFLSSGHEHVVVLGGEHLLRGKALTIELRGIKLHNRAIAANWNHTWLLRLLNQEALRLEIAGLR